MPRDHEASLGDQHTLQGGRPAESAPQSVGDQSTLGGGNSSSMADLTGLGTDDGLDMEIVDLSARYKVERVLGKGGMGEVLLAADSRLERKVAIKRIRGDATRNRAAVSRFLTEAKAIAALNHANTVQIHDYGRDKDGPFLIMEYVDGGSLLDRCRRGAVPVEEAVELVGQLCDGLARAHESGIIHRDIKPANVLLTKDGNPKLTDFGLAKTESAGHGQTVAGAVLGTIDFMPPEQRMDTMLVDARSDLWSLAATLYQMVTGESPRVIDLDAVPQQLRATLAQALKTKKEDRYQTAREFKAALRGSLQVQGTETFFGTAIAGEGFCPSCATHNEPHRKFCKQCAVSLRAGCLSCRTVIPVWDKVCPECGAQQLPLIQERVAALEKMQAQAESKLEACEFDTAREIAEVLGRDADPRFLQYTAWSKCFLEKWEARESEELSRGNDLMSEAIRHDAAYDYASAVNALNQIPMPLLEATFLNQTITPAELLRRVETKHEECRILEKSIRQSIVSRQFEGLLTEVDRLLQLRPDRPDVQKLRAQLINRDTKRIAVQDEAFAAAQTAMQVCDYDSVLTHLGRIDPACLQPPMRILEADARSKCDRRNSLQKSIQERLSAKNYAGLLEQVSELLELSPNNGAVSQLRDQLAAREQQLVAKLSPVIEQVRQLQRSGRFVEARQRVQAVAPESRNSEVLALISELEQLADVQIKVMQALESGLQTARYGVAEKASAEYLATLQRFGASDLEFERRYSELAAKNLAARARQRSLNLRGWAIACVILIIGAIVVAIADRGERQTRVAAEADGRQRTAEQEGLIAGKAIVNSIGMELNLLPAGTFTMGSTRGDSDEKPHEVTLTKPFYLGVYEVTQEQYNRVMGTNPSQFKDARNPVELVSWDEAVEFCQKLSEFPAENAAGRVYRLPTEAEWEYACRAGTATTFSFGDDAGKLSEFGWFDDDSGGKTHPVGSKQPNQWGLFDMHGNVWEWCHDWYDVDYYRSSPMNDPKGPSTAWGRVARGGSWISSLTYCRAAFRLRLTPTYRDNRLGLRVVLIPPIR